MNKKLSKRILAMILSFAVVFSMIPGVVFAGDSVDLSAIPEFNSSDSSDYRGTSYKISSAETLKAFASAIKDDDGKGTYSMKNKTFYLADDIALTEPWTPISNVTKVNDAFAGTFDGQGHKITGLKIDSKEANQGLFGFVNGATIKNLEVEGTVISEKSYIGGIVGKMQSGTVENCGFSGTVTSKKSSSAYAGGIIGGTVNNVNIESCYNKGKITGYAGGIVGYGKVNISNCYNAGEIKGTTRAGGIIGQVNKPGTIENSYSIGEISLSSDSYAYAGGISGSNGTVKKCFWTNSDNCNGNNTGNNENCEKITSAEALLEKLKDHGFVADINNINDGYPILAWETGSAPVPAEPSISIASSEGTTIWSKAGGSNKTQTTLTVNFNNMNGETPAVTWEYDNNSAVADFSQAENSSDLTVIAKQGGTVEVTAKATYNGKEYTSKINIIVIPDITYVEIVNADGGAVAKGQTVKAKVLVSGADTYDESILPELKYQWYGYDTSSGKSELISGATDKTYTIPEAFKWSNIQVEVSCGGKIVSAHGDHAYPAVESADKGKLYPVAYDKDYTLPENIKEATALELKTSHTKNDVIADIVWSSSNEQIINSKTGEVNLPQSGKSKITLTAKFVYNGEYYNRTFEITVWSQEEVDKEKADKKNELKQAVSELGSFYKLYPVYGEDTNVVDMLKSDLKDSSIDAAVKSVKEVYGDAAIGENGQITYFYADPNGKRNVWFGSYRVTFTLTKDGVSLDLEDVPVIICWDKEKVKSVMNDEILSKVSETEVLGENESLENITSNLVLPKVVDGKKWTQISWTSSDDNVIAISNKNQSTADTLFNPYVGIVKQGATDKQVTLTAAFRFQHTNDITGREEPIVQYKSFTVTVKAVDDASAAKIKAELENKLETGFKKAGLTDAVTGEKLIAGEDGVYTAVNDIKYPTTDDFGVDGKYYPVVITSLNDELIASPDVNNAARTTVYRPAVGKNNGQATVIVTIYDKNTSVSASKQFTINVLALTQGEIDKEKELMTKVKAAYFDGIKNSNNSADNIVSDMHAFQEVYEDEEGNLVWVYDNKALVNHGIVPTALDGWYTLEAWRMFKSSNAGVVTHENLLVNRQKENKAVTITSALSSETLGKYGELYKKDPDQYADYAQLADLYYQEVSANVIVKGTAPTQEGTVSEKLSVSFALNGENMSISSTTVTGIDEGISAFEVFDKVLKENGYSYTSKGSYVSSVTSSADITLSDNDGPNSGWLYTVNGIMPNEYMGSYIMKNNDSLLVYYTADWTKDSQAGAWTESKSDVTTSGTDTKTTTSPTEVKVSGNTATATVTDENAAELVKQARENKSAEIVLNVSSADTDKAETVNLELNKKTLDSIVNDTDAAVTVKTQTGEINLDKETLKQINSEAAGDVITIEITRISKPEETHKALIGADGQIYRLTVKSGDSVISQFKGNVTVRLAIPAALKDRAIAAVHIKDGSLEKLEGSRITQDKVEFYEFKTPHFSEFALVDTDQVKLEADDDNADKAKALVKELKLTAASSKTVKKNVKITVKMNSKNNALIKELKGMGYTVKYKYYRSTKKASKYSAVKTKTAKTYINTKGKKGTRYYYKAKVMVYDGDKLVAQSALKQCRYAMRTWSK